jgi:hypothetical protein
LRHTVAVILRESGYEERTIVDALGQTTIEMASLYARGVDLTKKMTGVANKFGREVKVSNLSRRVASCGRSWKLRLSANGSESATLCS